MSFYDEKPFQMPSSYYEPPEYDETPPCLHMKRFIVQRLISTIEEFLAEENLGGERRPGINEIALQILDECEWSTCEQCADVDEADRRVDERIDELGSVCADEGSEVR